MKAALLNALECEGWPGDVSLFGEPHLGLVVRELGYGTVRIGSSPRDSDVATNRGPGLA